MRTQKIINFLLVNLISNSIDYPWYEILISSRFSELNNTKALEQLTKFIEEKQSEILILINTDDLFMDVSIPSDHTVEIPEPEWVFSLHQPNITFKIYFD